MSSPRFALRPRLLFAVLASTGWLAGTAAADRGVSLDGVQRQRLEEIKALAPAGFTVLAETPFIIAGDEPAGTVRERAASTVRWTVERLQQDFFARVPAEAIVIWLFKDKESYNLNTWRLYQEIPHTPFGYYSADHQALIMNIATGSGTLVHEIVHPFMRTNFPACPPWYNEGLASLFEQTTARDGHIAGLTNWRLPGLQEQIREHQTVPFADLFALDEATFYGAAGGYNRYYGQSRYLCYYLQEHDLLVKFHREFLAHASEDPTGLRSLKKILGTDDLAGFQKQWEAFVLKLHYP